MARLFAGAAAAKEQDLRELGAAADDDAHVVQLRPPTGLCVRTHVQAGLEQARVLGADAERATALVRSGASCDVEGVLLATRKADAAFQMLQAVRNAMLEAYAQVRDMRG